MAVTQVLALTLIMIPRGDLGKGGICTLGNGRSGGRFLIVWLVGMVGLVS